MKHFKNLTLPLSKFGGILVSSWYQKLLTRLTSGFWLSGVQIILILLFIGWSLSGSALAGDKLSGSIELGGGYNSNVSLLSDSDIQGSLDSTLTENSGIEPPTTTGDNSDSDSTSTAGENPSDFISQMALDLNYPLLDNDFSASISYLLSSEIPAVARNYSFFSNSLLLDLTFFKDEIMLGLGIMPRYVLADLNNFSPYYWVMQTFIDLFIFEGEKWATNISVNFSRYSSLHDDVSYLQGTVPGLEVSQYYYFDQDLSNLAITASIEKAYFPKEPESLSTELKEIYQDLAINYGYLSLGGKLACTWNFLNSFVVNAKASIRYSIYEGQDQWLYTFELDEDPNSAAHQKSRKDFLHRYNLNLSYKFIQNWQAKVYLDLAFNHSSLGTDDYIDRNYNQVIFGSSMEYTF